MRPALAVLPWLLAGLLAGCSLGTPITRQAIDYNEVVEQAANTLLVKNILRARDEAPLHFTTVPQIRGSLSIGINQPGLGLPVSGSSAGLTLGLAGGVSPTFDVSALDTQEFVRGLLDPLEGQIIRYYWERGYPEEMLLLLLYGSVEEPGSGRRHVNDPRCWLDRPDCPGSSGGGAGIREALDATLALGRPFFHSYTALIPLGPPMTAAQAREPGLLGLLAEGKLRLAPRPDGRFQLYRTEEKVSSCYRVQAGGRAVLARLGDVTPETLARGDAPACVRPEVLEVPAAPAAASPAAGRAQQVHVRSVQEIIRFLGTLVKVQAEMPRGPDGRQPCLPFDIDHGPRRRQACLFQLLPGEGPDGAIAAEYGGRRYHVPPFREPAEDRAVPGGSVGDYSMRVLALLTDLVNLKKSSSAIPTTRAVQILR